MRKTSRIIIAILVAVVWLLTLVVPVVAGDGKDEGQHDTVLEFGDTRVLDGGYEATFLGVTIENGKSKQMWQVDLSAPKYVPNTGEPISCSWELEKGVFFIDQNIFRAEVRGDIVNTTYQGQSFTWQPIVYVGGVAYKPKDATPTLLGYDPINSHPLYYNNTLEWDYGVCKRHLRVIEGELLEYFIFGSDPKGDVRIAYDSFSKTIGFIYEIMPEGYDAEGNLIAVVLDGDSKFVAGSEFQREELTYPVTIDPTSTFYSSSSDGFLHRWVFSTVSAAAAWSWAHDTASADSVFAGDTGSKVGVMTSYWGAEHVWYVNIDRACLYFDTSSLPDAASVSTAELDLYVYSLYFQLGHFDTIIQGGMPTYPHDPLVVADYNYSYYSDDYGQLNTSAMALNSYNTWTLTATGKSAIDLDGVTKFILREEDHDEDDVSEFLDSSGNSYSNNVFFYAYEKGEGYRPKLVVTYTATAPAITADAASSVATTTARLNSTVADDGDDVANCEIRFGYGTTSQAAVNFNLYDTITSWDDNGGAGWAIGSHPFYDASGLVASTPYFYRVQIKNTHSTVTSTNEITFTTDTSVGDPSNFAGFPSFEDINLVWTKGTGATNTLVRFRTDTYPTGTSDGEQIYFGTDNTFLHEDLESGANYYYRIWGESGAVYSGGTVTLLVTTAAGEEDEEALPTPGTIERFFTSPNYSNLSGLPLVYDGINGVADALSVPRATFWFGAWVVLALLSAGAVFWRFGGMAGLITVNVVLWFGWGVEIVPWYFPVMALIFGVGLMLARRESVG